MIARRDLGLPAGFDHGGRIGLGDDRRPFDLVAGLQRIAQEYRRAVGFAAGMHIDTISRLNRAAAPGCRRRGFGRGVGGARI